MARIKANTQQNLVETIKVAGCTLSQISKATGISLASLHDYSNGIGEVSTANLERLAEYFGVEIEFLRNEGIYRHLGGANKLQSAKRFRASVKEKQVFEKFIAKRLDEIATGDKRSNAAFSQYTQDMARIKDELEAERQKVFADLAAAFDQIPELLRRDAILMLSEKIK